MLRHRLRSVPEALKIRLCKLLKIKYHFLRKI